MSKTVYKCSECNETVGKWTGRCPECGAAGTIQEVAGGFKPSSKTVGGQAALGSTIGNKYSDRAAIATSNAQIVPVSEAIKKKETTNRMSTGIEEFDRVLGGGLVAGGVTILAGPPGVGKALEIDTLILTPQGFKKLRDIHPGDMVYAPDGTQTQVLAETKIFNQRPTVSMLFETGETIIADENHEWVVKSNLHLFTETITSADLLLRSRDGEHFSITASAPLESTSKNITPLASKMVEEGSRYYKGDTFSAGDVLHFSEADRYALLYSYLKNPELFTYIEETEEITGTVHAELADKLLFLSHSLGLKTEIIELELGALYDLIIYPRVDMSTGENLTKEHPNHSIKIEEITQGVPRKTKCIEVDHESHMFLAGETLIPTHNSSIGLAVAAQLASTQGKKVLYITGEETESQVAQRALRTGAAELGTSLGENLMLLAEQNLQNCISKAEEMRPDFILVDSLQALISANSESQVGSITQVTEVATAFTMLAKRADIPTILIGQVTKENEIAGPRVVEHLVDTVLFFESNSDTPLRFLRALKNRYGSTEEIGCFEHTEKGLIEVSDPSGFFVNEHDEEATGYASTIILEGVRPIPLEVNALTVSSNLGNPRRVTSGIEHARALAIQAVLSKYIGVRLDSEDVYIATAGGLRISDTATDLAIAAAIISSYKDTAIPSDYAFIGEVALTGEIRAPRDLRRRLAEVSRLGFKKVFCPPHDLGRSDLGDTEIVFAATLRGFLEKLVSQE